jgi:hypothetical protein
VKKKNHGWNYFKQAKPATLALVAIQDKHPSIRNARSIGITSSGIYEILVRIGRQIVPVRGTVGQTVDRIYLSGADYSSLSWNKQYGMPVLGQPLNAEVIGVRKII